MVDVKILDSFPSSEELKKRAELSVEIHLALAESQGWTEIYRKPELFSHKTDSVGDYIEYHWDDGGGQSLTLLFAGSQILLLAFDHECSSNFYSGEEEDIAKQVAMYEGVPENLMRFVSNVDENYWNLNIELDDDGEETISSASFVAWFDGEKWNHAPNLEQLLGRYNEDGGLGYCSEHLVPKEQVLSEESVRQYYFEAGYDEDELLDVVVATYRKFMAS